MSSKGISVQYWLDTLPLMLESLAQQTPGMTAYDVAEVLDDMDFELTSEANDQGECMDVSDGALVNLYLALL